MQLLPSKPQGWIIAHMKTVKVATNHFTVPHLSPGVVSFCFDDHVHNNHLICSGCNTQSCLTLLLQIQ